MNKSNIFSLITNDLTEELFEDIVKKDGLKIQRIVSYGHKTSEGGWYDQDENEWVILLQGEAVLSFENDKDVRLKEGDYVNILAHTRHRVSWTQSGFETIWLAIHYK